MPLSLPLLDFAFGSWWSLGLLLGMSMSVSSAFASSSEPSVVKVVARPAGGFTLERNGAPFEMRGAGGSGHLALLRASGGNTIRTWSVEQLEREENGQSLLDRCAELDLAVMAGIWVEHERHGFDYDDPVQVAEQRERVRTTVRRFKDHPAVLIWGLGNEMEGPQGDGGDPRIWRELEVLARIVKEEDPNHPVCSVIAGAGELKVRTMIEHCPSVDIVGVNAYGGAENVGTALRAADYHGPYILAEFGPVGHWEVEETSWGAPIEPWARDKAERYTRAHEAAMNDPAGLCLGTFCFIWGQKQETTATWFGMFLPDGTKTPAVDEMFRAWTGEWPENRCPSIESMEVAFAAQPAAPGSVHRVRATVTEPDGDPIAYDWLVVGETTDRKSGGDPEEAPPSYPECVLPGAGAEAEVRLPKQPGAYRLFLFVRDGRGGGSADNVPFFVQ